MKKLFKNYNFWISFIASIILVLQIIGKCYNIKINIPAVNEILTSVCILFIFWGVISIPNYKGKDLDEISKKVKKDVEDKINETSDLTDVVDYSAEEDKSNDEQNIVAKQNIVEKQNAKETTTKIKKIKDK